jgi:hypothetical protein
MPLATAFHGSKSATLEGWQEPYPGSEVTEAEISRSGIGECFTGKGEGRKPILGRRARQKRGISPCRADHATGGEQCRTRAGRADPVSPELASLQYVHRIGIFILVHCEGVRDEV